MMKSQAIRRILLSVLSLVGVLSWGAPADNAPGKTAPGGANNTEYLYVFGPRGRSSAGAEDKVQVNFYRFPAGSSTCSIWVYSPGSGGKADKRSVALFGRTSTAFSVYGGAGAHSAKASQSHRPSSADQPGTLLDSKTFGKENGNDWVQFGPYDASQGETIGGHTYFKLVVAGVDGATANFFSTAFAPAAGEAFSYNISMNMTAPSGASMFFDVEVPQGATRIHEYNYDMDNGGDPYLHTGSARVALDSSRTGRWTSNAVNLDGRGGRLPYEVVKGIQGYANAAWYVLDADGHALKLFFDSAPAAPVVAQVASNECHIKSGPVSLHKIIPAQTTLGETFAVTINVRADEQCADVVVRDAIPEGSSFVSAQPAADRSGGNLSWNLGDMAAGEGQTITVNLRADREGELKACATVVAIPKQCLVTKVGRPVLAIEKSGPETAILGDVVPYQIVVTNTGTATAENVVVTDTVPAGLKHEAGSSVTLPVGNLAPGESRTLPIAMTAAARGRHCNVATASSDNAASVKDDACTLVQVRGLEIAKTGTPVQYLGKIASYTITVKNTGDTDLTNVVVTDSAPAATIVRDGGNGSVAGNTITWNVGTLAAGASKSFDVKLTTKVEGTHCNRVGVTSAEGLSDDAEACTLWKGYPAVLIELIDTVDPLLIGEMTTYVIRVTNQGTADDTNVGVTCRFPAQVTPISAAGSTQATVNGKIVNTKPYPALKPGQVIEWRIEAKASAVGDSRLKVDLNTDLLKTPVVEEESTHVY